MQEDLEKIAYKKSIEQLWKKTQADRERREGRKGQVKRTGKEKE